VTAIDSILAERLKHVETLPLGWNIWEHRTLNLHRGVLHAPAVASTSWTELAQQVREISQRSFQVRWWRGFGFGVVIETLRLPQDVEHAIEAIDVRANRLGTWQWLIIAASADQAVIGLHTWKEGYLSSVFRALVDYYCRREYFVGTFTKEPDRLLQFLLEVGELKGVHHRRFEEG